MMNLAEKHSLEAFMNSFLRDFISDDKVSHFKEFVKISLCDESYLIIWFSFKSILGANEYDGRIEYHIENDMKSISFKEMAELLESNFFELNEKNFSNKVFTSVENIKNNINHESNSKISEYLKSEKGLKFGHPFHPYPKYKGGMDQTESRVFSAELDGSFKIIWLRTNKKHLFSNIDIANYNEKIKDLLKFDLGEKYNKEAFYIPCHPWQFQQIRNTVLNQDDEIITGLNNWYAQSSMRSVYNPNSDYILKFSMDVVLTNSIRHLQPEEIIRGNQVDLLLKDLEIDNFNYLSERFYCCLKNEKVRSVVQFRKNIPESKNLDHMYVLSYLNEKNPLTTKSKIWDILDEYQVNNKKLVMKEWFEQFLENVIQPFLDLACNKGILLGAHQQNIIIELEAGFPKGVIYRDCQGSGISNKAYEGLNESTKGFFQDQKNILNQADINKVFTYYLIINTVFGTTAALAGASNENERFLLTLFRNYLKKLNEDYKSAFIDHLLTAETLDQKGNFRCCISNINENTTNNPWDIYNKIPNPLIQELRPLKAIKTGIFYKANVLKNTTLTLREFSIEDDIQIFHKWHNKEYVYKFWEMNESQSQLKDYITNIKNSAYQLPIILEINGNPAGYFEAYWANEDRIAPYCESEKYDRGVHLLIGEEKYLKSLYVYEALKHITKFLLDDCDKTQRIWGEPRADNKALLKLANKLPGWEFVKEFNFPHKRAALIKCEREQFYKEFQNGF